MIVGTGDLPFILHFYEKNGFCLSHRIHNFLQTTMTIRCLRMGYSLWIWFT